jgi:antitoxin MazE
MAGSRRGIAWIGDVDTLDGPGTQLPEPATGGSAGVMRVRVKKWGSSAAVRIPAPVMAAAHLALGQTVDVREEAGRIVIEPVRKETFDLAELVEGITDANRHEAIDFGAPVGWEPW